MVHFICSQQENCWSRFGPESHCEGCKEKAGLPNYIGSVTICVQENGADANERESEIGTVVFYGLSTQNNEQPKICKGVFDLI